MPELFGESLRRVVRVAMGDSDEREQTLTVGFYRSDYVAVDRHPGRRDPLDQNAHGQNPMLIPAPLLSSCGHCTSTYTVVDCGGGESAERSGL